MQNFDRRHDTVTKSWLHHVFSYISNKCTGAAKPKETVSFCASRLFSQSCVENRFLIISWSWLSEPDGAGTDTYDSSDAWIEQDCVSFLSTGERQSPSNLYPLWVLYVRA
jgi:hypothetical protein